MKSYLIVPVMAMFGLILNSSAKADPDPALALAQGQPKDVADFINREITCNHWTGEEPYDAARAKEIEKKVQSLKCDGLDDNEAAIRKKYKANPKVLKALDDASNFQ